VESTTIINGTTVAEPVPRRGATTPVVPPPVEKSHAEEGPAPPSHANETPPAKDPSPPPVDPAPSTPKPEVAAPQRIAVTTDGEVVEPVLTTSQPVTHFGQVLGPEPIPNASRDVIDPAPATPAAPTASDDWYVSVPAPDPVLLVTGPAAANSGHVLPPAEGLTPSAPVPTVPASVGSALGLPSSLGTNAVGAVVSAVGTVRSAAASVATDVLGTLADGSLGASYTDVTNGTQEEEPSEGSPQQPAPPLAPPAGGGSFSPSTGGGQLATSGWGFAPLVVGILALLVTSLLRRDFRTYLISYEVPKPTSALLLPLERPG